MYAWTATNQLRCWDTQGREVACAGSGQDGEWRSGQGWPEPRFAVTGENEVEDRLTGLNWCREGNAAGYALTWTEALEWIKELNGQGAWGRNDWRLPNRREMRSLIGYETRQPALPEDHPFRNIFVGWCWTSTTAAIAPAYAWYVHLEGGRMFYGRKSQYCLAWPVRGVGSGVLAATGQKRCYDGEGREIEGAGTGQDGELRLGRAWPEPRFTRLDSGVRDNLTGLIWLGAGGLTKGLLNWQEAISFVAGLGTLGAGGPRWRLPGINELETLVDGSEHDPALPTGHPFTEVGEAYWSATTSCFDPAWAYALYLHKGAVGVGFKGNREFLAWPVCGPV